MASQCRAAAQSRNMTGVLSHCVALCVQQSHNQASATISSAPEDLALANITAMLNKYYPEFY